MPSAASDIPTQPQAPFGPEWLVAQFTAIKDLITQTNQETRDHMDVRLNGIDDRLRKVETGETGCRADIMGKIQSLVERVDDHDDRLVRIESGRNTWNLLNSLGIAIAAIVAWFRGHP